ncbi:MAG TPA: glycosyltransferase [Gaiellaceae bacterium]|nr:glycosyltransferase [Gaiellaceae bacterium]
MPPRILILTASVGEGHDAPARRLADQLRAERPDALVETEDCLPAMGRSVSAISEGAARVVFFRFLWLWDVGFWVFARFPLTRRITQWMLVRFGSEGLLRLIASHRPDVVVSVYPNATEVLGRLRKAGRLHVPVCAVITDLAGLRYWATPGADLHLVTHPEAIDEVREIAGTETDVHCVHGFSAPEFLIPRETDEARRALNLEPGGKIVIVSGGGWGVGDVEGAVREVLAVKGVDQVVCLCGHNAELLESLERDFASDARVRAEPFTHEMPEWLAAADALVHSTGGLTVLEALMRGCPAISYGWGRGHVRLHNRAFTHFGLAEVAATPEELRTAVADALERGRTSFDFSDLPSAASFVLSQVEERRAVHAVV